jgi:hypothetical protein
VYAADFDASTFGKLNQSQKHEKVVETHLTSAAPMEFMCDFMEFVLPNHLLCHLVDH